MNDIIEYKDDGDVIVKCKRYAPRLSGICKMYPIDCPNYLIYSEIKNDCDGILMLEWTDYINKYKNMDGIIHATWE
jgi:hypothetical protein